MNQPIFEGIATALVTPLTDAGINFEQFGTLIDWQIDAGIDALVICGTTGESSTLTDEEHRAAIEFAVKRANRRVPIIAGTGSNHTDYAVDLTRFACEAGADACLVVTPYYNKATQKGLVKYYTDVADASSKPIIVYNVPSRTGVNIEPSTYAAMADHPNLRAIKEANSNIAKIVETSRLVRGKMDIYSGNDDQVVPILSMGGRGCISVLSNVLPKRTRDICTLFWNGDFRAAAELQGDLIPLINALFCEVNPIPVKAAVAAMGLCDNMVRPPLTPMEPANYEKVIALLRAEGLAV